MDPVLTFVAEARRYCAFIESASRIPTPERMKEARVRLLALYSSALALPDVEPDDREVEMRYEKPSCLGFDDKDIYWEVYDPYDAPKLVCGSLFDDLLDIHRDMKDGLAHWDAAQQENAIWSWCFLFDAHWGDHAVDALRALHRACKRDA